MDDSTSQTQRNKQQERPLLVVQAKLKRVVIGSLITVAVLGVFVLILLSGPPTAPGKPDYRASGIVVCLLLMPVTVAFFFWARYALRWTLTPEYLQARVPGWRIQTITIPLPSIRRVYVEKRVAFTTMYGGRYYRDYLIIPYKDENVIYLQIGAYHSRDLWMLLTTIKKHAPQVKFDADMRRFLYG